jgi:putative mRNA 3-end processing factor
MSEYRLIEQTKQGLYCTAGDFYIDPIGEVDKAIITHGHSDHARIGAARYICHEHTEAIIKHRLGSDIRVSTLAYGESHSINGVRISLHPAGHVLGSAQVKVEHKGEVWVVSGDYKLAGDPTCAGFESVTCDVFISESTFGLPIFQWHDNRRIFTDISTWWQNNQAAGQPSIIGAYSLGKAQRIMASVEALGPIILHGAVQQLMPAYLQAGLRFPDYYAASDLPAHIDSSQALIIAPPSAFDSSWSNKYKNAQTALASGWMNIRGNRRRRNVQRGFALSDHADWPALLEAISASQAQEVVIHHGYHAPLVRYLNERGVFARAWATGQTP